MSGVHGAIALAVFTGAGITAFATIAVTIGPRLARIRGALRGEPMPRVTSTGDRWRAMHIAADQRAPHRIRVAAPRRGLLGRVVRR